MSLEISPRSEPSESGLSPPSKRQHPNDPLSHEEQAQITTAVAEIVERRGVLEQAKGMLMFIYGLNADAAFALLKWLSQENNIKVRTIAERITSQFVERVQTHPPLNKTTYDALLIALAQGTKNQLQSPSHRPAKLGAAPKRRIVPTAITRC
jgi:predicted nucleic acid-binding protein